MSTEPIVKEYSNGEITVVWKPQACIHSGICLRGLPEVFDLKKRPWVTMDAASSEAIVGLVRDCLSKALSIKGVKFKEEDRSETQVNLIHGGPLIIRGGATVTNRNKEEVFHETVSFCRCGRSNKFPYCDGTHAQPKAK
ncbi:(4Fe-4S)-binding protein [Roseivirga pacifica]|uniref:(4Fe-4S)-binding protein n=1 Tax=Roseivirga pacifica TaxID=1267423 RepID=UPI0020943C8B|nr:(4Fe-4S)-binding protein [Roseivirga pacifica]